MRREEADITPLDLKCTSTASVAHMRSGSQQPRDAMTAGVASAGVVRPPLVVLASLLLGAALTVAWPLPFFPHVLRLPVGGLVAAMAAALFVTSIRQLRVAGTLVPSNKPTTAIVRTRPYR